MDIDQIIIQTAPSPHVRVYHSRMELSAEWLNWSRGYARPDGIAGLLSEIRGVEQIFVSGYRATVVKGQAFTWEEIEPHVQGLLKMAE